MDANRFSTASGWDGAVNLDMRPFVSAKRPEIGVSDGGSAILLLGFYDGTDASALFANRYLAGVGWSDLQTVEETGTQHLYSRPAMNSCGVAQAIWAQFDQIDDTTSVVNLYSNRFAPGTGWSNSEVIDTRLDLVGTPQVALGLEDLAVAVWAQRPAGGEEKIFSARYVPERGWGPVQQISSRTEAALYPQIAIGSQDNAVVVWIQRDDSDEGASLYMNEYRVGSGWIGDTRIGPAGGHIQPPSIDVGPDDSFHVIWTDLNDVQHRNGIVLTLDVQSSNRPAGQNWTEPTTVDVLDGPVRDFDLASDPTGGALAVWSQYDNGSHRIFASRFSSRLGWATPQRISANDNLNIGSVGPQIAVDAAGKAISVWIQDDGQGANIYANRFQ